MPKAFAREFRAEVIRVYLDSDSSIAQVAKVFGVSPSGLKRWLDIDERDSTGWRICRDNGWWRAFGKKRGGKGKPGAPAHDDLGRRDFMAHAPNRLWPADITEHPTGEGKLYLCAIKDVFSNPIVGYSIDSRMKSRFAVTALDSAVTRRGDVAGCILYSDLGSQFRSRKFVHARTGTAWSGQWDRSARPATTPPWSRSSRCCRRTSSTGVHGAPARRW